MVIKHVHLPGYCYLVLVLLLSIDCSSGADSQVKATPNTGLDLKKPVILDDTSNSTVETGGSGLILDHVKGGKDELSKSKDDLKNDLDKSVSSEESGSKEGDNVTKKKDTLKEKMPNKEGDEKQKPDKELKQNEKPKEGGNKEMPLGKDTSPPGEECDISNRCIDKDSNLIACLRVPGNDSPDVSILIQNKGKIPLKIMITAPDYVDLEMKKIALQPKEDKKVKVSIKHGGKDNLITLKTEKGHCTLDFKDLVGQDSRKETDTAPGSNYTVLNRIPIIAIIFLASFLIIASIGFCMRFKWRHVPSNESKYQKLDMELPVSDIARKPEFEVNDDGWDNSWDDNWDDEEAPKTPSMPLTPSLLSKGLAARRSNKDAWKD